MYHLSITRKKENRSIGYHFSLGGYHWDTGHNHWRKLDWDKIIGVNWRLCFLGLTGTQSPGSGLQCRARASAASPPAGPKDSDWHLNIIYYHGIASEFEPGRDHARGMRVF
jgi:hypothetical protein